MSARRVVLVRHARTDYNALGAEGRVCGMSDPSLNAAGVEEARALRELVHALPIDLACAGTLTRSRQTLEIILGDSAASIVTDTRLNELDYGAWEGLTKGELSERFPGQWHAFENDPTAQVLPGGETAAQCAKRAAEWLAQTPVGRTVAVVDKTWTRLLLCDLLAVPLRGYRDAFDIKLASITSLVETAAGWRIDALNYGATRTRALGG